MALGRITSAFFLLAGISLLGSFTFITIDPPEKDTTTMDARIDSIMAKMELIDKVGEMTQLAIDAVSVGQPYSLKEPHELDEQKLKEVLIDYRVGSILNVGGHSYTLEHWREIIGRMQDIAVNEKPTGIPILYGVDAVHGANFTHKATLFPQQIAIAATWNPERAMDCGKITAYELRASYIPWTFSPSVDMGRDPRWGRLWEGFGEDVLLSAEMGAAMVEGLQGEDTSGPYSIAACMKHFTGYGVSRTGKDRTPTYIPERQLREYHLPAFQAGIDANAATLMISSGELNGIPVHTSRWLLHDVLREEMGFEGVLVSDWEDIPVLVTRHQVAKDLKEAIKMAVNAGMDMAMVPFTLEFPRLLKELVEEGEVPMSRIDEAVRRILKLKLQLGLFENPTLEGVDFSKFASAEHQQASQRCAEESITLLKNEEQILPLQKGAKVLVTGPTANNLACLNGGWTGTWQGNDPKYFTPGKMTILEAIQAKVGNNKVSYAEGAAFDKAIDIAAAVDAAKKVDVIIACVGELSYTEMVGSIEDMHLPAVQLELIQALAQTGKPIVLVITGGRPRIVREMIPLVKGTLMAYYPGDEGGPALANILYGDVNPGGCLPYTYPRHPNSLFTYDIKLIELLDVDFSNNAFRPQWEFGFGMSYTTFEYSDMKLSSSVISDHSPVTVSITLKNTGERAGHKVVQLYSRDMIASITPPLKRLRAFEKVFLEAGTSTTVKFELSAEDLAFVGRKNTWVTEPGVFKVMIGDMEADLVYQEGGK
jgi:beta-glucosidase